MPQYRYKGEAEVLVPDLHLIVKRGDVVEADGINNADFELVIDKAKKATESTPLEASA